MSRFRRGALQLEPLEGKVLLSTARVPAALRAAEVAAHPFSVAGTLKMPTTSVATFSVSGQNMGTFKVSGRLGTMGQVHGQFVALLDADNNMTVGLLSLSNARGSVHLTLTNDPVDATAYDFTVGSGTGAFASASGAGKMATSGLQAGGHVMTFAVTMR